MIMIEERRRKNLENRGRTSSAIQVEDNSTERQAAERQRVQLPVKDGQLMKALLPTQVFLTKVLTLGLTKKFSGMSL